MLAQPVFPVQQVRLAMDFLAQRYFLEDLAIMYLFWTIVLVQMVDLFDVCRAIVETQAP